MVMRMVFGWRWGDTGTGSPPDESVPLADMMPVRRTDLEIRVSCYGSRCGQLKSGSYSNVEIVRDFDACELMATHTSYADSCRPTTCQHHPEVPLFPGSYIRIPSTKNQGSKNRGAFFWRTLIVPHARGYLHRQKKVAVHGTATSIV